MARPHPMIKGALDQLENAWMAEVNKREKRITALESEIATLKAKLTDRTQGLETASGWYPKWRNTQTALDETRQERDTLKDAKVNWEYSARDLQRQLTTAQAKIREMETEADEKDTRLEYFNALDLNEQRGLMDVGNELLRRDAKIKHLRQERDTLKAELAASEQALADSNKAGEIVSKMLEDRDSQPTTAQAKIRDMEAEDLVTTRNQQAAMDEAYAKIKELQAELTTTLQDCKRSNTALNEAEDEIEQQVAKIKEMEGLLDQTAPYSCPLCGPHVMIDEDECCASCGTDCLRSYPQAEGTPQPEVEDGK